MTYVNGFLAPVRKDQLDRYKAVSQIFSKAVMANGAVMCAENVGEGLGWGDQTSFPRAVDLKEGEVVVFSWIVWPSKEAAERGNDAVMADPDLQAGMRAMDFDGARMIWAGFENLTLAGVGA